MRAMFGPFVSVGRLLDEATLRIIREEVFAGLGEAEEPAE